MGQSYLHNRLYGFYLDRYGLIRSGNYTINKREENDVDSTRSTGAINYNQPQSAEQQISLPWLKFITLFWNRRVLWAAIKFGLAALIMNRYERFGFAILIICFAL